MKLVGEGIVYLGEKDSPRQSCAFPGICPLSNGRWLCGFRTAPYKTSVAGQCIMLSWSDDEGVSWHEPIMPFTSPELDGKRGAFRALQLTSLGGTEVLATLYWVDISDTSLPFFNEETQGLLDSRIMHALSHDCGKTWSQPVLMDTSPFNDPTPITGPALLLANGNLACQFETNKTYYNTSLWVHNSVLMFSADGGRTWPEYSYASRVGDDRVFYWDQRPSVLCDGRILDLFWTFDEKNAVYRNIHARESLDNGRTWSEMWDTGVSGQPAPPVSLSDGSTCMVYVDRTAAPCIKARISRDFGRSWPEETELLVFKPELDPQIWIKSTMQDAWAEMGAYSLGLPHTSRTPDGDIVAVYYTGDCTDHTGIRWAGLAGDHG